MPEVIDLGYCPRCGEDFIETSIGFIKHVKFCLICRDQIGTDEFWINFYVDIAERAKEVIEQCTPSPTTNGTKTKS